MKSIQEVLQYKPKEIGGYMGPTTYQGLECAPWNHPTHLANTILDWVKHTVMYGVQIIGPPGHAKSTLAEVIAHHIHLKNPDFKVVWAGAYEFTHQKQFFESLPKYMPHVVIFDDISGALGRLKESEINANFEALTTIRWILDPERGKTPVVLCPVYHYSKKLEKAFRAQFGMTIFAGFGNEERTNIDTLAMKGTTAYKALRQYSDVYQDMYNNHAFSLYLGNGKKIDYKTDDPFRCVCALSQTDAHLTLIDEKDVCDLCTKKTMEKWVEAEELFDKIKTAYGTNGIQGLRFALLRRQHYRCITPKTAVALDYIENKLLNLYKTDMEKLVDLIYKDGKKRAPKRLYHKRKEEDALTQEIEKISEKREIVPPQENISTSTNKEE